jgi:phosphoribosylglycinamide formyltransferase-1
MSATTALITYDTQHLKTDQVLGRLVRNGGNLALFGLPFKARPARQALFQHRPEQFVGPHVRDVANAYGIPYQPVASEIEIPRAFDRYIVLGAGILAPEFVEGRRVLNCHPGVIPLVRGLDAFKWAILDSQPIGVTLHWIDERIDAGEAISIVRTPVVTGDTLDTLARRHYELEIEMMGDFASYLANPRNDFGRPAERAARMRMPRDREEGLAEAFERYKEKWAVEPPGP